MITKSDDISRWWEKAASVITSGRDLVQEVELLKNMYTLRRSDEVSSFLNDNEDLARILADAYEKIRKHFPSEEIFLEIFRDPSSPGDKEVLVSVSTSLAPKEAIGKLDLFDDEWYLIDANIPNLNMCVKVEYK